MFDPTSLPVDGRIIMLTVFGSHLYGTDTPESDRDYKGIYLPSPRTIYSGKIPRSFTANTKTTREEGVKNGKGDIDCEIYSLHHFLHLLKRGETAAMDMLHVDPVNCITSTLEWFWIWKNRQKAYSRNMSAFVGYARRQAAKYGIKGSRLHAMEVALRELERHNEDSKLGDIWKWLPEDEHLHKLPADDHGLPMYQVCGKRFQSTSTVGYVLPILKRTYDSYGARAQQAKENKGIDWKAISHALRAAYQMISIFERGDIKFPLPEADLLREVKKGGMDYTTEVAPLLETMMDKVEELSLKSDLPEKVDHKFWDDLLTEMVEREVIQSILM